MKKYSDLGYKELVKESEETEHQPSVYLSHLLVINESSATMRLSSLMVDKKYQVASH